MDSDDDDLSDEEYASVIINIRQAKVIRLRPNHFDEWNDSEFYKRFRLCKQTAQIVLNQIAPRIKHKTNRNHALSAECMFLLTLRFYASGGMLIATGDFCGVSKSTASIVVKKVSIAICMLRDQYLKFPETEAEINSQVLDFYHVARFPRVIAALDCTHVKILSPGGQTGEIFRNRKGFFSLNVQAMCDSNLKIMDLVARWPGSSHDSTIFGNSRICSRFESGEFNDKVVVADSGYPTKAYIMTPLRNCSTAAQERYNQAQISTRNCVERVLGVWKRRFPVLALGLRLKLASVQSVILATGILHNICCDQNDCDLPALDDFVEEQVQYTLDVEASDIQSSEEIGTSRSAMIEYFGRLSEDVE